MNIQNRLGIWISKYDHLKEIKNIISKYDQLDDIFLISDESLCCSDYAIVSSYYVTFYDSMIAFLDLEDFIINKDNIVSNNITLFCSSSDIINSGFDKSFFKNVRIIEL